MNTDEATKTLTGVLVGLILATFLFSLVVCWPIMIALGILHSEWSGVPAFGFLQTFVLVWAADLTCRIITH